MYFYNLSVGAFLEKMETSDIGIPDARMGINEELKIFELLNSKNYEELQALNLSLNDCENLLYTLMEGERFSQINELLSYMDDFFKNNNVKKTIAFF
ncbi:MAG: hypothetical protein CVU98_00110 [Firmicutes bacterium HGW-Firmicutes-3]|jgi:hypothetical protein|nr:MAG: hypothetical protein CVU98_00110 [Firmicutes bacterium HGW-Firmicutes-3]